jgi:hypothetical protein
VDDIGDKIIYAGAIAGSLSALGLFAHYAIVRPLRGFLRREIVGNLVEIKTALDRNSKQLGLMKEQLKDHIRKGGHHE